MPARAEVAYFGAGPAGIPTPVLERGAAAFVNFEDSGLGLAEISHRSSTATKILDETKKGLISLLDIPDNYDILFLHGGGSGEFSAVVFNMVAVWVEKRRRKAQEQFGDDDEAILLRVREELKYYLRLDYLITGSWSLKASQEAAQLLDPLGQNFVNVALDARETNEGRFGSIPPEDTWKLTPANANSGCGSAFVYYCDNETVDGVEFPSFPQCLEAQAGENDRLVICDMSSNFLSRRVDVKKYAVIFGGAQKNIGITDITLAIVRKDLLGDMPPPSFLHKVGVWSPPTILNWQIVSKNNSLYNTLPIFSVWIAGEVLRALIVLHGDSKVAGQEAVSNAKAETVYRVLDTNPDVYQPVNHRDVRSRMNICFRVKDPKTEKQFLAEAEERLLQGLKGHRSVGGIRASNYNSVSMDNISKLAEYLTEFAQRKRRETLHSSNSTPHDSSQHQEALISL
ncbi:Phosphoserine transaminase [Imshaugia aleurites]|uniref:phosphoserine transaminase n=1 Tax=Imshaugia aleurites TaxID=172621 RepID=A0A8H3F0U1_9LECA|nr:Phosphoserine transaminase [Imshaugia aleurites]